MQAWFIYALVRTRFSRLSSEALGLLRGTLAAFVVVLVLTNVSKGATTTSFAAVFFSLYGRHYTAPVQWYAIPHRKGESILRKLSEFPFP